MSVILPGSLSISALFARIGAEPFVYLCRQLFFAVHAAARPAFAFGDNPVIIGRIIYFVKSACNAVFGMPLVVLPYFLGSVYICLTLSLTYFLVIGQVYGVVIALAHFPAVHARQFRASRSVSPAAR